MGGSIEIASTVIDGDEAGEPVAELINKVSRSTTNLSGLDISPDIYIKYCHGFCPESNGCLEGEAVSRTGALCFSVRHHFHYRFRGLREPWPGFESRYDGLMLRKEVGEKKRLGQV